MNNLIKVVLFPFTMIALLLIMVYKVFISPFLANTCKFQPTCSTYSMIAYKRFGIVNGTILTIKRLLRCVPKSPGGLDAVPDNIKGDIRWLL